jgi:hypothetical protein
MSCNLTVDGHWSDSRERGRLAICAVGAVGLRDEV